MVHKYYTEKGQKLQDWLGVEALGQESKAPWKGAGVVDGVDGVEGKAGQRSL